MDSRTETKYKSFVDNPLSFQSKIDQLKEHEGRKPFVPVLIVIKRYLVLAYAQALYDNDLITPTEFTQITDEEKTAKTILSELEEP
jgi:hypothetical protein